MYIAYSVNGIFCTKRPYKRTVGKLLFNKEGKYKRFFGQQSCIFELALMH